MQTIFNGARRLYGKRNWILFLSIQIIILFVATFVDLDLSHKVYSQGNPFGYFLELFGELPLTVLGTLAGLYKGISYYKYQDKKMWAYVHFFLAGLFSLMTSFQIPHYLSKDSLVLSLLIFLIMMSLVYYFVKKLPQNDEKLLKYASLIIFVAFMNIITINVIKQFWGRERYRHMVLNDDYSGFSQWFIPQGMASGEEFKSFPSGHSANASIIMLLALYPYLKENKTKTFIVVALFTTLVQFSRIMQGAHFLSDVTMGVIIGLLIIFVGAKIFRYEPKALF